MTSSEIIYSAQLTSRVVCSAAGLRQVFGRMGFGDREIVALSGAHALGRCHATASGYVGPWTPSPTTFNNLYFVLLKGM